MESTLIRKANQADLNSIEGLNEEIHEYHRVNLPDSYKKLMPGSFREHTLSFIGTSEAETFIAEKSGKIVGFVQVKIETVPENAFHFEFRRGLINALGVSTGGRRDGIGSLLMDAAEKWIQEQGLGKAVLNVLEFNDSAIKFYDNRGYKTSSRRMALGFSR